MKWGLALMFIAWVGIIARGLLMGGIDTRGLLREPDGSVSPARVQLLFSTVALLAVYAAKAATFQQGTALPDLDTAMVAIFGASHGVYLSNKAVRGQLSDIAKKKAREPRSRRD